MIHELQDGRVDDHKTRNDVLDELESFVEQVQKKTRRLLEVGELRGSRDAVKTASATGGQRVWKDLRRLGESSHWNRIDLAIGSSWLTVEAA